MEPHPYQIEGDAKLGVPALRWTEGDDLGNVESLIEVSTANLFSLIPQAADARYDFATRTFRSGEGKPLSSWDLDEWASSARGSGKARLGSNTVKRGVLLNTLARAESGERPGLLEQALRQQRELVTNGGLRDIFYQRQLNLEAAAATEEIHRIMPRLRAELDRLDLKRASNPITAPAQSLARPALHPRRHAEAWRRGSQILPGSS
ncbi:hypothetical protein [Pseudogemmobacter sonorensis]|uniref:hypothetical protein n=1 Tax=Pseudogemmobacter sonorensis TaxID=2989681 RepID=UPI00368277AC